MRRNDDLLGHGPGCPCVYCQQCETLEIGVALAALFSNHAVQDILGPQLSPEDAAAQMREDLQGFPRDNVKELEFEPDVGEDIVTIKVTIIEVVD